MFVLRGWQVYVRGGLSEVVIFAGGLGVSQIYVVGLDVVSMSIDENTISHYVRGTKVLPVMLYPISWLRQRLQVDFNVFDAVNPV